MTLIKQPNSWSCLPTSFAMVLGVSLSYLLDKIGHDGSEVLFSDLMEPERRRGFHPQEMISFAWGMGFAVTPFEVIPSLRHDDDGLHHHSIEFPQGNETRIRQMLKNESGVLTGRSRYGLDHAVAWCQEEQLIYDPVGVKIAISDFYLSTFWVCANKSDQCNPNSSQDSY